MVIKFNFISLLLIVGIILNLFATCKKTECIGNAFSLKETWGILPQRDSINISDTLYLSSTIYNHPYDYNKNGIPFAVVLIGQTTAIGLCYENYCK